MQREALCCQGSQRRRLLDTIPPQPYVPEAPDRDSVQIPSRPSMPTLNAFPTENPLYMLPEACTLTGVHAPLTLASLSPLLGALPTRQMAAPHRPPRCLERTLTCPAKPLLELERPWSIEKFTRGHLSEFVALGHNPSGVTTNRARKIFARLLEVV